MHITWQMVAPVMCIGLWLLHRLTNSPLLINLPWSYILSTLAVLRFSIQMLTFQLLNVWCKTISWIHSLLKLPFLVIASHSDFLHFTVGLYFITGFFIIISSFFTWQALSYIVLLPTYVVFGGVAHGTTCLYRHPFLLIKINSSWSYHILNLNNIVNHVI